MELQGIFFFFFQLKPAYNLSHKLEVINEISAEVPLDSRHCPLTQVSKLRQQNTYLNRELQWKMASLTVTAARTPIQPDRNEVYVASMPLRAAKGPAQLLMSAAYSLNLRDLQHYLVIIRPISPSQPQAFVFDFQPQDPENIYVALAALSGRGVPGEPIMFLPTFVLFPNPQIISLLGTVLVRKLTKLPKTKCWFIGFSYGDSIQKANKFNEIWQTELSIGQHDCRDYTNGEEQVLKRLRGSLAD
ncbi:uncharacterized protein LOC122089807 isoform X2 [Macadamia integrifolia]|uniref:uncharacterized protein LOC122089807 isoform X2 n=1 Tax=Macadamia integrifolia TaxID=60698 RepID=UPI001C4EBAA0|nr:uncharacterized protein LOC122089807 isoform X2 [Macadamia integrifolia]